MAAYNDIRKGLREAKGIQWVFCLVAAALLLVPLVGMAWASDDSSSENRKLAAVPELWAEAGGFNVAILGDWGDFFADHFAYRTQMVDLDARLYSSLFGVSTTDQVVVGDDGWLYYAGTLNDYQGRAPLRERQARNIAVNLRMLQDYCQAQGARFVFAIAPDKNALYGEAMPYFYPAGDDESMEMLKDELTEQGVSYVDLFAAFRNEEEVLYFLRDSHWSDRGALLAQDELVESVGSETLPLSEDELVEMRDYVGDLSRMLFPVSGEAEANWYAQGVNDGSGEDGGFRSGSLWRYVEGGTTEDDTVRTASDTQVAQANGSLIMYRDSFANNLIPYLATEYDSAMFTKLVPYNGLLVAQERPQVVMVERAQRHIAYLGEAASIMPCPMVVVRQVDGTSPPSVGGASCELGENGPLLSLTGQLEGVPDDADADIFVRVTGSRGEGRVYRAFALTNSESGNDWGYHVYVSKEVWQGQPIKAEVLVGTLDHCSCAGTFDFVVE